jgi:hypothetical protein
MTAIAYPTIQVTVEPLVIDEMVPTSHLTRFETTLVAARVHPTFCTARRFDHMSAHSPLFDLAVWARGLGDRVRHRTAVQPAPARLSDLFATRGGDGAWVPLGERADRELAFGAVGKVWQPSIDWRRVEPEEFAAFAEPGWAKVAAALCVLPYGEEHCLLTYETRAWCTDEESLRHLRLYWHAVSPGIGVVLRATLRGIKETAEKLEHDVVSPELVNAECG